MLDTGNLTKMMLERLGRSTAATPKKDMDEGRAQNPLSTVHWLLEIVGSMPKREKEPRTYRVSVLKGKLICGTMDIPPGECGSQEEMDGFCQTLYGKLFPAPASTQINTSLAAQEAA